MKKKQPNNWALTYEPKFESPFDDDETYLVPACKNQHGRNYNYIVVTCSPKFNGVYRYDSHLTANFKPWLNGELKIYYVPISICTYVSTLEDTTGNCRDAIKKQQMKWINGKVKNHNTIYQVTPDWCLEGVHVIKHRKPKIEEEIPAKIPEEQVNEEVTYSKKKLWEI